jgi:hypothetical protein
MASAMSKEDVTNEIASAAAPLLQSPITGSAKSVRFSNDIAVQSADILARSRSQLKRKDAAFAGTRSSASSENTRGKRRPSTPRLKPSDPPRTPENRNVPQVPRTIRSGSKDTPSKSRANAAIESPGPGSAWPAEDLALLKKMYSEGDSWDKIGEVFHSVVSLIPPRLIVSR